MAAILIIDNDADLSRFLEVALRERGHKVECLERAEPAPALLAKNRFDLILLDNIMPGMTGIDFLALLERIGFSQSSSIWAFGPSSHAFGGAMGVGPTKRATRILTASEIFISPSSFASPAKIQGKDIPARNR